MNEEQTATVREDQARREEARCEPVRENKAGRDAAEKRLSKLEETLEKTLLKVEKLSEEAAALRQLIEKKFGV